MREAVVRERCVGCTAPNAGGEPHQWVHVQTGCILVQLIRLHFWCGFLLRQSRQPSEAKNDNDDDEASEWVSVCARESILRASNKGVKKILVQPLSRFLSLSHSHTLHTKSFSLSLSAVPIWDFSSPFRWLSMAWPWTQIVLPTTLLRFFYERVRAKRSEKKFFQIFIFSDSGRCHLVLLVLPPPRCGPLILPL